MLNRVEHSFFGAFLDIGPSRDRSMMDLGLIGILGLSRPCGVILGLGYLLGLVAWGIIGPSENKCFGLRKS